MTYHILYIMDVGDFHLFVASILIFYQG